MGLTIHWDLKFKGTEEQAKDRLTKLVNVVKATGIPVKEISEVWELDYSKDFNNDVENARYGKENEDVYRWAKIQYQPRYVESSENGRRRFSMPENAGNYKGYVVRFWVGDGCEPTNIGLTSIDGKNWKGGAFTKTQYAVHFVNAHLTVIAILDTCKFLGILKNVSDEGDYWKTRDLSKLADNINEYDKLVSSISGALKRTFGESNSLCATDTCRQKVVIKARGRSRI